MRKSLLAIAMIALFTSPSERTDAAVDASANIAATSPTQLIVMEAPGCIYCNLFRRDVLPTYQKSTQAKDAPVRFVDINNLDKEGLTLDAPINVVPTFIVIKNNKEIGRIPGYMGQQDFFHSISYILSTNR